MAAGLGPSAGRRVTDKLFVLDGPGLSCILLVLDGPNPQEGAARLTSAQLA